MCMVLIIHIGMKVPFPNGYNFSWIYVGGKGVQLFFVLSGYLICNSVCHIKNINYFYKKRIARIIPGYYFALIVGWLYAIIVNWKGIPVNRMLHMQGLELPLSELIGADSVYGIPFVRYFFFLQMFIPSSDFWHLNNLNGLWTMSSFAFFYVIIPWIVRFFKNFKSIFIFTAILFFVNVIFKKILFLILKDSRVDELNNFISFQPIITLACFMLGVTLYYAIVENKMAFYSLVLLLYIIFSNFSENSYECIFTIVLGIMITSPTFINHPSLIKCIREVSDMSFSVYLLHMINSY